MLQVRSLISVAGAVLALSAVGSASADVVTFSALPGANGSAFTTYSEGGYTVTKLSGSGCVAGAVGNPAQSVFGGPVCDNVTTGVFSLTGSGLFSFASIDLLTQNGNSSYTIAGLVGSSTIWTQTGSWSPNAGNVFTTLSAFSAAQVDKLTFAFSAAGTSWNFDNIVVNPAVAVPEPGSFALVGLALFGVAVSRRRPAA